MVLWLLILRGLAIELRHHVHHHLWGEFWDVIFSAASLGLALLFGVALGNLLRGVPLNEQGYFFVALWTNLRPYADPQGILDWFTVMIGLLGVAALIMHGGNFLAFKVGQPVGQRAARTASLAYWPVVALTVAAVVITPLIQPLVVQRYITHPAGFILPIAGVAALGYVGIAQRRGKALHAFIASGGYILLMIVSAAYGIYPNLLIATTDPAHSLTIENAAAPRLARRLDLVYLGAILPRLHGLRLSSLLGQGTSAVDGIDPETSIGAVNSMTLWQAYHAADRSRRPSAVAAVWRPGASQPAART